MCIRDSLNSLLQAMFMTPELRSFVFSLPICDKDPNHFTTFLPEGDRREIIFALQKLFAELKAASLRFISTEGLTHSFHWDNSCLLYTSPSPRDQRGSRMPSSA
eukprot:TRINITY_DN11283_c0_g1_i1.p2 TRINITY_DN11283_c0_g1~~TRINITY_DN11283_c0_g1_i1.p2  ORF type:complete len:116 (+),score=41.67 TRINITY_DN11283_c0_g1_i1:38-349(+)